MTIEVIAIGCLSVWVLALHFALFLLYDSVKNLYSSMLSMVETQRNQQAIDASLLSMVQSLAGRLP